MTKNTQTDDETDEDGMIDSAWNDQNNENKLNWYYPNVQLRQDYEELEELYINKGE